MKSTPVRVLEWIRAGETLDGIVVDSDGWKAGEVVALARENGYALNVSSKRFQPAPKPGRPTVGIVRPTDAQATLRPAQRDLITEGKISAIVKVRKAADRAENALQALADVLDETRATEAARREIERLEQELRDAKAALKGTTARPATEPAAPREKHAKPPIGVDYRALDAWCQETGREWRKTKGRPSNALIAEFNAANGVEEAS